MAECVSVQGDLVMSLLTGEDRLRGALVHLTPTEFRLLSVLAAYPGKPLTTRTLRVTVWGEADADAVRPLRAHIQRLRRKLRDDPTSPQVIATERGIGYRFIAEEGDEGRKPGKQGTGA